MKLSYQELKEIISKEINKRIYEVYAGRGQKFGGGTLDSFTDKVIEQLKSNGIDAKRSSVRNASNRFWAGMIKNPRPGSLGFHVKQYVEQQQGGEGITSQDVLDRLAKALAAEYIKDPQLRAGMSRGSGEPVTAGQLADIFLKKEPYSGAFRDFVETGLIQRYAQETGVPVEDVLKQQQTKAAIDAQAELKSLVDRLQAVVDKEPLDFSEYQKLKFLVDKQEEKVAKLFPKEEEEEDEFAHPEEEPGAEAYKW